MSRTDQVISEHCAWDGRLRLIPDISGKNGKGPDEGWAKVLELTWLA